MAQHPSGSARSFETFCEPVSRSYKNLAASVASREAAAPTAPPRAPYPGLRSFRHDESDLFFGRESFVSTMVDRLAATRFLSVLGSSGTGKSSVVRTGLLDSLELGLMAKAGSSWRVADFRPGSDPLRNLAGALLANEEHVTASDRDSLRGFLARGPRAVIEWCRDGNLPAGTNLLLLADQFEELFRYQDYAKREETQALVELLLESAHSTEFPIYVTITMRSEYLGACAFLDGLAETISRGMVLIPRLTREQCRMAIVGPADVCGIRTDQPLVNQLLNDLTSFASWDDTGGADELDKQARRADQLPLLQYTLNRMWLRARERRGAGADGRSLVLRLADYETIGGLRGALNEHANQLLKELQDKAPEERCRRGVSWPYLGGNRRRSGAAAATVWRVGQIGRQKRAGGPRRGRQVSRVLASTSSPQSSTLPIRSRSTMTRLSTSATRA